MKRLHPDQNRGKDTVFWGKKSGGWGRYVFIVVFLSFFLFFLYVFFDVLLIMILLPDGNIEWSCSLSLFLFDIFGVP